MKIALIGGSGYIGRFLLKRFAQEQDIEVLTFGRSPSCDCFFELSRAEEFDFSALDGVDLVVFTAAISGPDECARDFERCWAINVTGTSIFIREAIGRGCRVLFFSSDAVFGDIPGAIYDEHSETRAVTPYGRMKKAVEDAFRDEPGFKAIRLSYVASARDRFVSYCLDCIRKDSAAEVFHPFYRNCIAVSDVVDTVVWFIRNWDLYDWFVLNVAGNELVSRVRIADELNRCLGNRLKYTVIQPNAAFYLNRPAITQMRSLYRDRLGIYKNNTFTEKIQKELEDISL